MAQETVFIVQSFGPGKGNRLKADPAVPCKDAGAAQRMAQRLALTKLGVVAMATSGDVELGEYDDEPTYIFRAGQLPEQFDS